MIKQKTEKRGNEVQKVSVYSRPPPIHGSVFADFSVERNSKSFTENLTICIFFHRAYLKYWLIIFIGMTI